MKDITEREAYKWIDGIIREAYANPNTHEDEGNNMEGIVQTVNLNDIHIAGMRLLIGNDLYESVYTYAKKHNMSVEEIRAELGDGYAREYAQLEGEG